MTRRRSSLVFSLLGILTLVLSAGCETGFVADAYRSSAASFINQVVSSAVNETVNP